MTRPGKMAGVLGLLAALLVGAPASADSSDIYKKDLQEQVRELREELASLRRARDLDSRMANTEMKLMADRLDRIERSLSRLTSATQGRTARFYDPVVPAATGTIRLDNRLTVPATVTIDGVSYTVEALSTSTLRNQPTGTISYTVTAVGYGIRSPRRTPVRSNETLTLTIY